MGGVQGRESLEQLVKAGEPVSRQQLTGTYKAYKALDKAFVSMADLDTFLIDLWDVLKLEVAYAVAKADEAKMRTQTMEVWKLCLSANTSGQFHTGQIQQLVFDSLGWTHTQPVFTEDSAGNIPVHLDAPPPIDSSKYQDYSGPCIDDVPPDMGDDFVSKLIGDLESKGNIQEDNKHNDDNQADDKDGDNENDDHNNNQETQSPAEKSTEPENPEDNMFVGAEYSYDEYDEDEGEDEAPDQKDDVKRTALGYTAITLAPIAVEPLTGGNGQNNNHNHNHNHLNPIQDGQEHTPGIIIEEDRTSETSLFIAAPPDPQ